MGRSRRPRRRSRISHRINDLTGNVYGRLTVTGDIGERTNHGGVLWQCLCSCGNTTIRSSFELRKRATPSCGCYVRDRMRLTPPGRTHGMSDTRIHISWKSMRARCLCKNNKDYPRYGGRGITIDDSWSDFAVFHADMGDMPETYTLDRIDNDGNYGPKNCRWADSVTQRENSSTVRLITYRGVTKHIRQWSTDLGINYGTLYARLNKLGWSVEDSLEKEVDSYE